MAAFELGKTLTENGTVARGVCEIENGYLKKVTETLEIDKNSGIPLDAPVSMNMWGLGTDIFDILRTDFVEFLKTNDNPLKGEFYIPKVMDQLIREKGVKVKAYTTDDRWYGVTYKADSEGVRAAIADMTSRGMYNGI